MQKDIFISHADAAAPLAKEFVHELLIGGLEISEVVRGFQTTG